MNRSASQEVLDPAPQRWTPRNPLGVIALFVFLIETIATVSLGTVKDKPFATILVWFIVAYPVYISTAFFLILCLKRVVLFGPMDYGDPAEFSRLLGQEISRLDKKFDHLEAKQDVANIDRATPPDEVRQTVDKLLAAGDPWSAITAARKLLERREYEKSLEILEYILERVGQDHASYFRILANIAYSEIGLGRYEQAIQNLLTVKNTSRPRNFGPWHALALAYAYFKTHNLLEYQKWIDEARKMQMDSAEIDSLAARYPEIADDIRGAGHAGQHTDG